MHINRGVADAPAPFARAEPTPAQAAQILLQNQRKRRIVIRLVVLKHVSRPPRNGMLHCSTLAVFTVALTRLPEL